MYFITVLNDVITGLHAGDIGADFYGTPYYGHNRIEVPRIDGIRVFDSIHYYTHDWKRKTDYQLIDGGLISMPEGYVREGDALRRMTKEERIIAGLDEPQPGFKVKNDEIVPMTLLERLEAEQISQDEYNDRITSENENELQRRLAELQTPEALAQAEIDEEFAAKRKKQLVALLAVKQQAGWPIDVKWPAD